MNVYEYAKERYAALGIDTEAALTALRAVPVSLHCWQGDDVRGFDGDPSKPLTGGIQTTGSYPGRARTPEELMADLDVVLSLIPGTPKMNLHASYAIFNRENGGWVDRDKLEPKHFQPWVDFCRARGLGCDFNPTFFSHERCDPLTLSSPNESTRRFWIDHGRACIRISQCLAEQLGKPCIMNIWLHDGSKGSATAIPSTPSWPSPSIFPRSAPAWRARCSASGWSRTPRAAVNSVCSMPPCTGTNASR